VLVNGDKSSQILGLLEEWPIAPEWLTAPKKAIACFDEILVAEPNHTEALVKKGAALEKVA